MSKVRRAAALVSLIAGLVAGVGVAGAKSASAATHAYTCTGSYPEVCLGVYSNGSVPYEEDVQANLDHGIFYKYVLIDPLGGTNTSKVFYNLSAGWGILYSWTFTRIGHCCAYINYGATPFLGSTSPEACV
jgi:hypothetical protein